MTETQTLAQLKTWLLEAELALHQLQTGAKVVDIAYEGQGGTKFTPASIPDLLSYVSSLKHRVALAEGRSGARRAHRVIT